MLISADMFLGMVDILDIFGYGRYTGYFLGMADIPYIFGGKL